MLEYICALLLKPSVEKLLLAAKAPQKKASGYATQAIARVCGMIHNLIVVGAGGMGLGFSGCTRRMRGLAAWAWGTVGTDRGRGLGGLAAWAWGLVGVDRGLGGLVVEAQGFRFQGTWGDLRWGEVWGARVQGAGACPPRLNCHTLSPPTAPPP